MLAALLAAGPSGPSPTTQGPPWPGHDIDLRSAWAVADAVVVGRPGATVFRHHMTAFDGTYDQVKLTITRSLKGAPPATVDEPVLAEGGSPLRVPGATQDSVWFFVSEWPAPRAIKVEPATPDVLATLARLPTTRPASPVRQVGPGSFIVAASPPMPLSARLVVPANPTPDTYGGLVLPLRLTNIGSVPVRLCRKGQSWASEDGQVRRTDFTPGSYMSDTPPAYEFARHVVTLSPGQWTDVPVQFHVGDAPTSLWLSATYDMSPVTAAVLDVHAGVVSCPPVRVTLPGPPATRPATAVKSRPRP